MIFRCLLCHGIIYVGAYTKFPKGWCQDCGAEYDFEIDDNGILYVPDYIVVEELKIRSWDLTERALLILEGER